MVGVSRCLGSVILVIMSWCVDGGYVKKGLQL